MSSERVINNWNCVVLLIGFNRPEFIQQRLSEIGENPAFDVVVSIDGGISLSDRTTYEKLEFGLNSSEFRFIYHESNKGMVDHITTAITRALDAYQNVIVIEDDVKVSKNFIFAMAENLTKSTDPQIATWGGFSPLRSREFLEPLNRWRQTKYFSAWGWGISRSVWQKYNSVLPSNDFDYELRSSDSWSKLSAFQRRFWKAKFNKVFDNPSFTWDYQMQFMTFKHDFIHILPTFRLTDNAGFGDFRSTNTKSTRPRWMGKVGIAKLKPKSKFLPMPTSYIMTVLDSLTFIGDSKLLKLIQQIRTRN